jgi:propanol-preferring alcohol dehydrogenase
VGERTNINKAWLFHGTGQPLQLDDRPDPIPGPRQVVIDVRAAGLCHSDIGILDGPRGWITQRPIVLGHEVAGVVRERGSDVDPDVDNIRVGDRVAIAPYRHNPSSEGGPLRRTCRD